MLGLSADVKGSVDEWIDHRVGHSAEEDPHSISVVDVRLSCERMDDEHDLVWGPADDECQNDNRGHPQRLHLRLAQQLAANWTARQALDVVLAICVIIIIAVVVVVIIVNGVIIAVVVVIIVIVIVILIVIIIVVVIIIDVVVILLIIIFIVRRLLSSSLLYLLYLALFYFTLLYLTLSYLTSLVT